MYTPTQRLMRSRSERLIAGVAGGIAQYMGIDPVIVRLAMIALVFTGVGILLYPILWVIMPQEGSNTAVPGQAFDEMRREASRVEREVRSAFEGRQPRYDSNTGEPLESEVEVPINNVGETPAANQPVARQRELGMLLLGFGAMVLLSLLIGPMFGKILFPLLLIGAGVLILRRRA